MNEEKTDLDDQEYIIIKTSTRDITINTNQNNTKEELYIYIHTYIDR